MSKRHKNDHLPPSLLLALCVFFRINKIEFFLKKSLYFKTVVHTKARIMSRMSYREVQQAAHRVSSDPELLRRHLWKTQPCHYGAECRNLEKCCAAHFAEEYRAPVCLHLEFCNRRDCKRYHPHLGSIQEYMEKMGVSFQFATRKEWESQNSQKSRRVEVQKMAHEVSTNPELLKKHLYKTQPCRNGVGCGNKEKCPAAHFADEYRAPVCLHLEFCNKDGCDRYHPHMGTVEGYMAFKGIRFEFATRAEWEKSAAEPVEKKDHRPRRDFRRKRTVADLTDEEKERMFPIGQGGKLQPTPKREHDPRRNTKMCRHASDENMCPHMDCGFAHSLDELVLPVCPRKECACPIHHDGQDRTESAKRILKIEIESWMLRPAEQNNSGLACEKSVRDEIQRLADEENDSEDDRNIDEIQEKIRQIQEEQIRAEIAAEMAMVPAQNDEECDAYEQFLQQQEQEIALSRAQEEFIREQIRAENGPDVDEDQVYEEIVEVIEEDEEDDGPRVILGPITSLSQLLASQAQTVVA